MQPQRIALFGLFGWGNIGNASTLEACLFHLRRHLPDAEICCVCPNPEVVAAHFDIPTFPIDLPDEPLWHKPTNRLLRLLHQLCLRLPLELYLWLRTYRFLRGYDQLIVPGTGILDDFGVGPLQLPYDLFKWSLLAKLTRTRLAFVSIGAGPIAHPLSRFLMKSAFAQADYRSYRDDASKQYMASIGFPDRGEAVFPDLVFSLPISDGLRQAAAPPQTIGIGVMEYYGWRNLAEQGSETAQHYVDKLARFVEWLLSNHYNVRLLIGQSHDVKTIAELRQRLHERNVDYRAEQLVAAPIESSSDLFAEIAQTDMVVATRFHNVLCALMLERPVISIGYAQKNDVLLAEMGLGAYCQHIESFDVERLISQFCELREQAERHRQPIRERNQAYRQALSTQYDQIFSTQDNTTSLPGTEYRAGQRSAYAHRDL